jgi:hypothetical protein
MSAISCSSDAEFSTSSGLADDSSPAIEDSALSS